MIEKNSQIPVDRFVTVAQMVYVTQLCAVFHWQKLCVRYGNPRWYCYL